MPLFRLNVISKKSTTFELVSMSVPNPISLNILMMFLRVRSICYPFTLRRITKPSTLNKNIQKVNRTPRKVNQFGNKKHS